MVAITRPHSQGRHPFAARVQMTQVWRALLLRELSESSETALGLLGQFVEPAIMILAVTLMAYLIERHPPFGSSMLLFSTTGVMPVFLFVFVSKHAGFFFGMPSSIYRDSEMAIIRGIFGFLKMTFAGIVLIALLYFWQTPDACPQNFGLAVGVWILIALCGLGVGLANRTIAVIFPTWEYIYPGITRVWLHLSGVYYVVDNLPIYIRNYLAWNPLIHAVTWFRLAFYPRYPHYVFSEGYFLGFVFVALVVGVSLQLRIRDRIIVK